METRTHRSAAVEGSAKSTVGRPLLLFFTERTSGPCRRMQSLVAWLKVTRKGSVQVEEVDVQTNPSLAERLRVVRTPTLVVVADGRPAARLEGRATGKQIDDLLRPFVR
jgi:thioredoxin-like negative regulator of GroEL